MAFQFTCPQGHLLQAEEMQAGQQCQCPECGVQMVIPAPSPVSGGVIHSDLGVRSPPSIPGNPPEPEVVKGRGYGGLQVAPDFSALGGATPSHEFPSFEQLPTQRPSVLHILCPNGHELETPEEMLGQDALCPICNVQFRLRYDNSLEYRREQEQEEERRQRRAASAWLNWSIVAAVVVVLGVILLFVVRAASS